MRWTFMSVAATCAVSLIGACANDSVSSDLQIRQRAEALKAGAVVPIAPIKVTPMDAPVVAARIAFKATDSLEFDMDTAIGVIPADGSCAPENDSWRGGPMFGKSDVRTAAGYKFCSYQRVSNVGGDSALPPYCPTGTCTNRSKIASPISAWLEPTPHALLRQASPETARRVASAVKTQLRSELWGLAQFPHGAPPPVLAPSGSSSTAALAVTAAQALPARAVVHVLDDQSDHGNAVAQLISEAACPPPTSALSPGCSIEIRRHDVFDVQPGSSVERGSAALLAQVIVGIADGAGATPTVINLSLGFHPEAVWAVAPDSRGAGGILQIGHLALQAAINYARCRGVVVVSAAGNRDGGGADGNYAYDGFMYPAAWHTTNGWTCGSSTPSAVNEPLLYAASAVRGNGRPVASARPGGEGVLVAPGFVNTVDPSTGLGRWYWEGSSFATAALSAAAARVRSYMPLEANALTVMRTLWSSGTAMPDGRLASGLGYTSAAVRRVRMCPAVRAALGATCSQPVYSFACAMQSALTCSEPSATTWPAALSNDRSLLDGEVAGTSTTLWQAESQGALPSNAACGAVRVLGAPDVWAGEGSAPSARAIPTDSGVWNPPNPRNAYTCPFETLGNGQSASLEIGHQPGSTGCHGCVVYRTASNKLVFNGTFEAGWAELSSSPALLARGVDSSVFALVSRPAQGALALAAPLDEAVYELGDALGAGQLTTIELATSAPESLDNVELTLEYVVEHSQQSYSIAQTVPLIDLL